MARMDCGDLPLRIFSTEEDMDRWLLDSKPTFDEAIDTIAEIHSVPRSRLLYVESWEYSDGELVEIKHVMNFEHIS